MKKIVFACHTMYQVFIAYIIAKTEYSPEDEMKLIIEANKDLLPLANRAKECGVWKEVYMTFEPMESEGIVSWLKEKSLHETDILHLGAWGGRVANQLSGLLSDDATVIINEEGTASYSWLKGYANWSDRYYTQRGKSFENVIDFRKIKKSLLFDSRISQNADMHLEEKNIQLGYFLKMMERKEERDEMNKLFCYNKSAVSDDIRYVFFDQNLAGQRVVGNDLQNVYLAELADAVGFEKIYIKMHPSEKTLEKLRGIKQFDIILANETPWEVIYINQLLGKKNDRKETVMMTYCSSAAFNSMLIAAAYGISVKIILLYKVINKLAANKILLDESVINNYTKYYDNICIAENFDEAVSLLAGGNEFRLEGADNRIVDWLQSYYFHHWEKKVANPLFDVVGVTGNVAIYGAGDFGRKLFAQLYGSKNVKVKLWVDGNYSRYTDSVYCISNPEQLASEKLDWVLIAIRDEKAMVQIASNVKRITGGETKIKWCTLDDNTTGTIISKAQVKEQIRAHEAISFDIFETLITRNGLEPHQVFEIVEECARGKGISCDFYNKRIQTEKSMAALIPNMQQLYSRFAELAGTDVETTEQLKRLELQTERELLQRNDEVIELLEYAKQIGKKVSLVSDMYMTKEILIEILTNLHITEYDELFVSCECHTTKMQQLFSCYKEKVNSLSYLHIGDHEVYDGRRAAENGIDVCVLRRENGLFNLLPGRND